MGEHERVEPVGRAGRDERPRDRLGQLPRKRLTLEGQIREVLRRQAVDD